MCTLIIGRDVIPGVTWLAANRDEDPERPSDGPGILIARPRAVGGRDRRAGGTWLAIRADAAVAMLNRRPGPVVPAATRSRGLLAIDIAGIEPAGEPPARAARARALEAVQAASYAPFSVVFATHDAAWILAWDGRANLTDIGPGWHVITHADLDDEDEPRTRRLRRELDGWRPASTAEAEAGLRDHLAAHDPPRVCIHDGRMQTVSYALVTLSAAAVRYLHADGRPCEHAASDWTHLLEE